MDKYNKFSLKGLIFKAEVLSVYDGDTFYAGIFFLDNFFKFKFRILEINAPEIISDYENAIRSRNRLIQLMGVDININSNISKKEVKQLLNNNFVDIECYNFDKYGRVLCYLFKEGINIGKTLLEENYAKKY